MRRGFQASLQSNMLSRDGQTHADRIVEGCKEGIQKLGGRTVRVLNEDFTRDGEIINLIADPCLRQSQTMVLQIHDAGDGDKRWPQHKTFASDPEIARESVLEDLTQQRVGNDRKVPIDPLTGGGMRKQMRLDTQNSRVRMI